MDTAPETIEVLGERWVSASVVERLEARVGELELANGEIGLLLARSWDERDAALARITALADELQDAQSHETNLLTKIGLYAQQVEKMERERDADRHANSVLQERITALEALPTDEQISGIVIGWLASAKADPKMWAALTYESGPYEITKVRGFVVDICRAVSAARRSLADKPGEGK